MVKLLADLHTHTRYSDGRGSVEDNVRAAAQRGLKAVAITDHGPRGLRIGVRSLKIYERIREEARVLEGRYPVKVMVGAEANVTDLEGGIDLSPGMVEYLDLLIVGLHPFVRPRRAAHALTWLLPNQLARVSPLVRERIRSANTRAIAAAVNRHPVDLVSHPNLMLAVNLDDLTRVCARRGTALEINTGHHYPKEAIVRAALAHGASLGVGSDAHFPAHVGRLETGAALLERMGVPPEQILNNRF